MHRSIDDRSKRNVEENKVLTLEEAVHKTSGLPAKVYHLKNRGTLEEGAYADIAIINWQKLRVLGDELEPRRYPEGIEYVFVNGVVVVDEGRPTEELPGKVLTRELPSSPAHLLFSPSLGFFYEPI